PIPLPLAQPRQHSQREAHVQVNRSEQLPLQHQHLPARPRRADERLFLLLLQQQPQQAIPLQEPLDLTRWAAPEEPPPGLLPPATPPAPTRSAPGRARLSPCRGLPRISKDLPYLPASQGCGA